MKGQSQQVGVADADPRERVQIEATRAHVGEEAGPFRGFDLQANADTRQVGGHHFGDAAPQLEVGGLVAQFEAHARTVAVGVGVAGGVEQRRRSPRVVPVAPHVRVRPVVRRQQAVRDHRLSAQQVLDDGAAVDRVGQRAPHGDLGQRRVAVVDAEVLVGVVRAADDIDGGDAAVEVVRGVRIERVLYQVDAAAAQLERAHDGIGDDAEDDPERRGRSVAAADPFEDDLAAPMKVREPERTCADQIVVVDGPGGRRQSLGQNAEAGQVGEARVPTRQLERDPPARQHPHALDRRQSAAVGRP